MSGVADQVMRVWKRSAVFAASFGAVALMSAAASGQATPVKRLSQKVLKTMQVRKDGQTVSVARQVARLELSAPDAKTTLVDVRMAHEPTSGLYWWAYQEVLSPSADSGDESWSGTTLYLTGDHAVAFSFATPFLFIREVQGHLANLAAVQETAIAELQTNVRAIQDGSMRGWREINIASHVDADFLHRAGSASSFPQPKIVGVARAGARWAVTLEGPNRDTVTMTIDDGYAVVNVRHQPAVR